MKFKTMHHSLPLTVLALATTSLACPVQPGSMLNGRTTIHPNFRPVCGADYQRIKSYFMEDPNFDPSTMWIELYADRNTSMSVSSATAGEVVGKIQRAGYKDASREFGYITPHFNSAYTPNNMYSNFYRDSRGKFLYQMTLNYFRVPGVPDGHVIYNVFIGRY